MIEIISKKLFRDIPACVCDPYFSKNGYLPTHPEKLTAPGYKPCTTPQSCYGEHVHRELEVHYVCTGEYHAFLDGREQIVHAGELLTINPFETHSGYYVPSDETLYYYFTILDLSFFAQSLPAGYAKIIRDICSGKARFRERISQAELDRIAGAQSLPLDRLFTRMDADYEAGCSLRLVSGIYELLSLLLSFCISADTPRTRNKDFEFICQVSETIEQNYAKELTTGLMSEQFGYTESHFCRRFKKSFGTTFADYLCQYRLKRAADFKLKNKTALTDIAAQVGFRDYAYFSRAFSRYYGMPPMKYYRSRK
ncbi:MAG: AraC family transcriptional regulator [Clostridia bacterium]|nr:AraC family transcriptional regulator [Clostridia bacterium]